MYSRILTCGTFDLFHIGHVNILKKAKARGNYLIVGVSSDRCNKEKNKHSVIGEKDRMEIVRSCKYVDEVFLEDSLKEKDNYVKKYDIDVFIIGNDWEGKFDDLSCDVIYLPRTENISTTLIKKETFPDIWPLTLYEKCIHKPLDCVLMDCFEVYGNTIIIGPNEITLLSFCMFLPIIYINNDLLRGVFFIVHDILDRCDGSLARVYNKYKIKRDGEFGAYLDAICDKLFVLIIGNYLINNNLLTFKMLIHTVSIITRTYNYYYINADNKNKSTISGKMGTFMENMALSSYYLMPELYEFFMIWSIVLSIQSLYEKIK